MHGEIVQKFIVEVSRQYQTGHAREHAYRPALKLLFEQITGVTAVNDPKRSQFGAPDFVFLKDKIVIAYAEAKDINVSLEGIAKTEQMGRYYGYSNLILTNGLEFAFYRNGESYGQNIIIGKINKDDISQDEKTFSLLEDTIKDFILQAREPITSGKTLAKVMAGKARRIRDNIAEYLKNGDEIKNENLISIYEVIKKLLLADLDKEKFADMYSQTLVYGLFVARYSDSTPETFTRQEARDLVPASNPFLRHFFDHITGASFDPRIEIIVNELCEEFTHTDVRAIVHNYFKTDKDESRDPVIHFYEDFLREYNPKERMDLGVFYTPLPVVQFIVKSLDEILKKHFGLQGLADTSKIEIVKEVQHKKIKQQIAKVQILDPATGTGTFLNEVILHIKKRFAGQEGRWPKYAKEELLPRLHGFELMMAPYTIAHLKLSTTLKESGVDIGNQRIGIYLTNSLQTGDSGQKDLFSFGLGKAISEESHQAGKIKNDLPIMVVLGNPPYNVSSQNKGEWIGNLLKDYKKDLGEKKINLDDDYIKFIRFSQSLIEKNGEGVVGMITNNSYIDGITHRQMRKTLLEVFDEIYILDLHGNVKKKETAKDGSKDENVFDIQQGVAISIFVKKTAKKKTLGKVFHSELFGIRDEKYGALFNNSLNTLKWQELNSQEPYYFFVPKNFAEQDEYDKGFRIEELFIKNSSGIETAKDGTVIKFSPGEIIKVKTDFENISIEELSQKYNLDLGKTKQIKNDILNVVGDYSQILYRPFDIRFTLYSKNSQGVLWRPKNETMQHLLHKNLALLTTKRQTSFNFQHVYCASNITERCAVSLQTGEVSYIFPLYLYEQDGARFANFKKEIYNQIISGFKAEVKPENVFDYIYAYLHSPSYRGKYKEFLKIDFPRVPFPKSEKQFFELAKLGEELRKLHLMESPKLNNLITTYPESGDGKVEKIEFKDGKVYINKTQYFGNVPKEAWEFYIGGYQPAQKWLKDRKGRILSSEEISHWQKMIIALNETSRIMKDINP